MQDKAAIPYQHWSLKVGRMDASTRAFAPHFGEVVWGVDDLHQSISNLILTPLGGVPTEPEKGCDSLPYIDRPHDVAIPNVTRAIWDALTIWEPRIVLQDIKVSQVAFAHLSCEIYWRPSESVLDDILVTQVALTDQSQTDRRVA
jgi:phage baseplate assembly protein W